MRALATLLAILLSTALSLGQAPTFSTHAGDERIGPAQLRAAESATRRALDELRELFPGVPNQPFKVFVHRDEDSLPEAARRRLHPGTPGLAMLGPVQEIHLLAESVQVRGPTDLDTVAKHEVVHILIDQYAGPARQFVPRWLHEGLAQSLSGRGYLGAREQDLIYPVATDRLLKLTELREGFPEDPDLRRQAYAQSFSFVDFLVRRVGEESLIAALTDCDEKDWYRGAFARETRHPLGDELEAWRYYLRHESGANWRFMFENCFAYLMIAALIPLVLAGMRRWNRDIERRNKLEREELEQDEQDET